MGFNSGFKGLKSNKKTRHFTRRLLHIYDHITLNYFQNKSVSDESYRENQNTHFMYNNFFFEKSCRLRDNAKKKNIVQPDMIQMAIRRMHFACWISKATNTPSEYVILTAFPL